MNDTTALVFFDQAKTMLAKAVSVDAVKDIRDRAEALRLYAKQQKDSGEMQQHCAEIKIRCERRMGELLSEDNRHGGDRRSSFQRESLKDLGVSHATSHRYQTIAALPDADFEAQIATTKARGQELTSAAVYESARKHRAQQQQAARSAAAGDAVRSGATILGEVGATLVPLCHWDTPNPD